MDKSSKNKKITSRPRRLIFKLILLILGLSFLSFTHSDDLPMSQGANLENVFVIDIETAVQLVFNYSDRLFAAQSGIRSAKLNQVASRSEFDFTIIPNGKSGYIGGGSGGSGLSIGGGVCIEKKIVTGTQFSMTPSLLKTSKKYNTALQMSVSQPLLKGLGREYNMSGIKRAEFGYRSAIRTLYKNMSSAALRSIELLYEITKYEEIVKLNLESYQRLERFWKGSKIKLKIGLSNALDVNRAEIELKQAEDCLNKSKEALQDVKDSIREILALPQDTKFEVSVPLKLVEESRNLDEFIATAILYRIEVDQGKDQLGENRRLAYMAKKELSPDLNLVVDYSNTGCGEALTSSYGRKRESRWGVGFTTSAYQNNTRKKTAYDNALIAIDTAKNARLQIEKSIVLDVKRIVRALYYAREKIALQEEQIKNTQGGLKLVKIKFSREFATYFDVIQAEKSFHSAQINLISAIIDHKINEYRLRAAMGLLIEG